MKAEYVVQPNKEISTPTPTPTPNTNMYSKHQQPPPPFSPHFPVTLRGCKNPEDDDEGHSRSSGTASKAGKLIEAGGRDGATIEVVRRPRGRPPGSKNKPKPPVIITRDTQPAMSPYILEVPAGKDIVEAVSSFCGRKNTGLCVLSGSGTVANVTLKQPSTTPGATITFHGRFDILSISATFLAPTTSSACPVPEGFTISLAGPQGQIVGGLIVGSLLAAGTVYLVAASFNNPDFHRLPAAGGGCGDDHDGQQKCVSGGGDAQSPPVSGGGRHQQGDDSCGVSMYSCHTGSDVIWAPAARQSQPPY